MHPHGPVAQHFSYLPKAPMSTEDSRVPPSMAQKAQLARAVGRWGFLGHDHLLEATRPTQYQD